MCSLRVLMVDLSGNRNEHHKAMQAFTMKVEMTKRPDYCIVSLSFRLRNELCVKSYISTKIALKGWWNASCAAAVVITQPVFLL